ncbi:MAG: ferrous iron transport protein B [Bacteroidales bacterium]|nr:ferrous iron transport protein B [Bacteroidales bacterium]
MKNLNDLKVGESARLTGIEAEESLRRHFLEMGLIPGSKVTLLGRAPMGDPLEIRVQGYSLTLRTEEAKGIRVEAYTEEQKTEPQQDGSDDFSYDLSLHEHNAHPGLGEEGKYHHHDEIHELPKGTPLTFALVGQQNCGKTTLFNRLTGSNQHVGNFPGVTVDRKDGQIKNHPNTTVTDLPGIYSLSTYTAEELVARDFLLKEKPTAIINIVDATNIERNLYLTVQLMELGIPMVLALNMMDELTGNGGSVRINEMERELGIPVVAISAAKGAGIDELIDHAIHIAKYQETPVRQDFCPDEGPGAPVHRCLHSLMHLVEDHAAAAGVPVRFAADRLAENDAQILEALQLTRNESEMVEHIILQMEEERGMDRHAAMAQMRYDFIHRLCSRTVRRPSLSKEAVRTRRIDRILTGKWTAIPVFIAIIALIFYLTFDAIGLWLQGLLDSGISALGAVVQEAMLRWEVSDAVRSLVVDAIFGGVGSVLSFVPIIIVLFFFLSMLEDSGYMARVAFVSDKLLRRIGLSGRSIVPMLIGFGCTVPAVMACRTLPSARDRKLTILLTPFMSCSAKVAIYGFFAAAFFPGHAGLVMILLYLLGIVVGVLVALVGKWLRGGGQTAPFVMELPTYRLPQARNVWHLLWDKTKDFIQRAFTVIFLATLLIWFLQSFDLRLNFLEDSSQSILAGLAGLVAPVMSPLGLGDWRIVTALISGFLAKESVVATVEVLGVASALTGVTAVPMLIFCLLYTPCVAAISSIRRELGPWWAVSVVAFQCAIAWLCAWGGYLLAAWLM